MEYKSTLRKIAELFYMALYRTRYKNKNQTDGDKENEEKYNKLFEEFATTLNKEQMNKYREFELCELGVMASNEILAIEFILSLFDEEA